VAEVLRAPADRPRSRHVRSDAPTSRVAAPDLPARDVAAEIRSQRFVALVSVVGVGVLAAILARSGPASLLHQPALFWLISAFVFAGELFPIKVPRRSDVEEITTSTTFAFALLIGFGTPGAVGVLAISSAVADVVDRKPLWKALFNLAQYALAIAAAGAVYGLLGAPTVVTAHALLPILAAALTFFVVNDLLTGVAVGLSEGTPLRTFVVGDLWFQAAIASALLSLSPVVMVVAARSVWLVPLLAIPVAAVYWGATASLENTRLVARLEGSLAHMTELNRLKDDFVAVVSHELRTPLTSIQGYVKTLLQLEELEEDQRRSFLQAADRQGERLRRLIEQLLVTSRLESHVEPLSIAPVSIPLLVRHVVDELGGRAHGHTFDLRFDPALPILHTDEAKVHQIVSNLVENALKYSPPDTCITIRAVDSESGARISVHDEGPGIPAEARSKVFDRFYQVDGSTTRAVGGTGLGLYICRKMTETLGGLLTLDRTGPGGTVFSLWLPEVAAEDPDEQVDPRRAPAEGTVLFLSR
jgi:signal transduction histidine kinase